MIWPTKRKHCRALRLFLLQIYICLKFVEEVDASLFRSVSKGAGVSATDSTADLAKVLETVEDVQKAEELPIIGTGVLGKADFDNILQDVGLPEGHRYAFIQTLIENPQKLESPLFESLEKQKFTVGEYLKRYYAWEYDLRQEKSIGAEVQKNHQVNDIAQKQPTLEMYRNLDFEYNAQRFLLSNPWRKPQLSLEKFEKGILSRSENRAVFRAWLQSQHPKQKLESNYFYDLQGLNFYFIKWLEVGSQAKKNEWLEARSLSTDVLDYKELTKVGLSKGWFEPVQKKISPEGIQLKKLPEYAIPKMHIYTAQTAVGKKPGIIKRMLQWIKDLFKNL